MPGNPQSIEQQKKKSTGGKDKKRKTAISKMQEGALLKNKMKERDPFGTAFLVGIAEALVLGGG